MDISPPPRPARTNPVAGTGFPLRLRAVLAGLALALAAVWGPPAAALVRFDFEQAYYVHPERQVWDFSIIRADGIYHIFYHSIHEQTPHASAADTLWQATSPDLRHWSAPQAILTSGLGAWDAGAVWAPDVFRDEANKRWMIAYTGADATFNQSIGFATSDDLQGWTPVVDNPRLTPGPFNWVNQDSTWQDFRDPFVYRQDDRWHLLLTARSSGAGLPGVVHHAVSTDLVWWTDLDPLFTNDGPTPGKVLESCQYRIIGSTHNLLFGEFGDIGVSLISAADPADWTMADRVYLDGGFAPEVDQFDPGVWLFSRLANFYQPDGATISYVVRTDTLVTDAAGAIVDVHRPHPMAAEWTLLQGSANLANPTFGDNPVWRGEPSVGLVGNGYYGSAEYYRGPLSEWGAPGLRLGDGAIGVAESIRFPITGDRMTLLVGGGYHPVTCYVALVDDADDAILHLATGNGNDTMSPVEWDLTPYQGRMCYIQIRDAETGAQGHINVDEIVEVTDPAAVAEQPGRARVLSHRAAPNPFNPLVRISFSLAADQVCEILVWDVAGREVWRSGPRSGRSGPNVIAWDGRDAAGRPAAAGTYVYAIALDGVPRASGKVALVK